MLDLEECPTLTADAEFCLEMAERKFRRACEQIVLLNARLSTMEQRYLKAKQTNLRNFRYNYRLQLAVIEGVKNVYHDYARMQAERITELRDGLYGETEYDVSSSESEESEDEDLF